MAAVKYSWIEKHVLIKFEEDNQAQQRIHRI